MINAAFRPIDDWPGELLEQRIPSQFKAGWQSTLDLLDRELHMLGAEAVVVKLALTERDIRRDGWPRRDARPAHPGVIIEFDSWHGWLRYYDDQYTTWQDNLRALSLEALRALGRWGALRGEQYVGSRPAIEAGPAGIPGDVAGENGGSSQDGFTTPARRRPRAPMRPSQALAFLEEHSSYLLTSGAAGRSHLERAYRRAAMKLHPDQEGGDEDLFTQLQEARELLIPDLPKRSART